MDDPWGSPWADEVQLPQTIKPEEKDDVVIRPTTPARAATFALQEKTNSPWDETADDSFGDWATLPQSNDKDSGLDRHIDKWGSNEPAPDITTTKPASNAFSVDWSVPGTPDGQGKTLAPSLSSEVAQPARLPSPDPWASSFTIDKEIENIPDDEENSRHFREEKPAEVEEHVIAPDEKLEAGEVIVLPENATKPEASEPASTVNGIDSEDADVTSRQVMSETALVTSNLEGGHPSSRRSSSPSEHSQHDEMSQESPRTSFDEEPKRPQRPRVVSSKVQELVEHFDGLAKKEVGDTTASSTSSGQDTIRAAGETDVEEDDDFGDFEEGQSDEEQELGEAEQPCDDHIKSRDDQGTYSTPKRLEGPVDFNIDMSPMEQFFPNLEIDTTSEKIFIPDTVPFDSFVTTEERKLWYRISRYGTFRKHNTGDDDYVRINWAHSQIRKETLNIVARWMEEDRISGRVVLGGASKGSSIFGWNDKKVGPVPLGHAFATKAGKGKFEPISEKAPEIPREWPQSLARKMSTSKDSSRASRRNSAKIIQPIAATTALPDAISTVETPVASFGWNSDPLGPQSPANHPLPGHKSTGSMSALTNHQPKLTVLPQRSVSVKKAPKPGPYMIFAPVRPVLNTSFAQPPNSTPSMKPSKTIAIPGLIDDDDDWGEMVASPVVNNGMVAALASEPLQFQANTSANTPEALNSVSSLVSNHGYTTSLEKINSPNSSGANISGTSSGGPVLLPASSATVVDPWASADFSFFETNPTPAPVQPPKPNARKPMKPIPKSVSFSPPPPPTQSVRKSKEEAEQDPIVQRIVKSLPDLSYMFKR